MGLVSLIGVTLGLAVYRTERPREIVIAITAIFLTIPSLALFGLFMPIFGLGWTSVVIALVMYGLLPSCATPSSACGRWTPRSWSPPKV